MEGIFGLLAVSGIGAAVYLLFSFQMRQRSQMWRDAARAAGVTNVQMTTSLGWDTKLTGDAGRLRIALEAYQRGKQERGTRVILGGFHHGPFALSVRAESLATRIEKAIGEREIEIGDGEFDGSAYIQGEPALIRALFDKDTRESVGALLRGHIQLRGSSPGHVSNARASISDDELRVDIPERAFRRVWALLPQILVALLPIGERLVRPADLASKIAANNRAEPLDTVRLANLNALVREFRDHPATGEALVSALDDWSPEVRVRAAAALGPKGRQVLLDATESPEVPDEVAALAIVALGEEFKPRQAAATLRQALAAGRRVVAARCIASLGREWSLSEVLAGADPEMAAAAAAALGATSPKAEGVLIAALDHESAEVRAASAEALGHVGTPSAVVPLMECEGRHSFDGTLRRSVRQAIAEIQSRVPGASPGQLSIPSDGAGQVSIVDGDVRGRVSLEPSLGRVQKQEDT
jgi:hypothetical protein